MYFAIIPYLNPQNRILIVIANGTSGFKKYN